MVTPYVGEIRIFAGNFAPVGWALCNGQTLSISQYDVLYTLIGTTYGGDGVNTFLLPNLLGRVPLHFGGGFVQGQISGQENVTLTTPTIPSHNHSLNAATTAANTGTPGAGVVLSSAASPLTGIYAPQPTPVTMVSQTIGMTGGNQPHNNLQPYLCMNYIIALFGLFPQQ